MANKISCPIFRKTVFDKYDGHCAYCGCRLGVKFTIDHFIPKRRYKYRYSWKSDLEVGSTSIENSMPCCQSCNSSKSDLTLDQFRERILDRVVRLNNLSGEYNIAKRFGLIAEVSNEVIFYFEKFEMQCQE